MIRMNSLVQASTNCDPPYFDNCWDTHRLLAVQGSIWTFLSSDIDIPGLAFRTLIPGGLPPRALAACMNLSMTDRLLAQQRSQEISVKKLHLLTSARASVQHQLLSLPAWPGLPTAEQGFSSPVLYECIRNAALLYCNAVIRPVLPGSRGILEPVRRLRQYVEAFDVASCCGSETVAVMIWCLVMGSLGSCSTQHWWFFIAMLRCSLDSAGIGTIDGLVDVVRPFVWSEVARREGLKVVWAAVCD